MSFDIVGLRPPIAQFSFVSFFVLTALPATAQVVTQATTVNPPILTAPTVSFPTFIDPGTEYSPGGAINCPTPSIGVYGFGSGGQDDFNNYGTFGSANTQRDNYGITGGLRIPLSPGLGEACKRYFEAKANFEQERAKVQAREAQLLLIRQCFWLEDNSFDLSHPGFKQEAFRDLEPCLALRGFADERNKKAAGQGGAVPSTPPRPSEAMIQPFSPESPIIIEERSRSRRGARIGVDVVR